MTLMQDTDLAMKIREAGLKAVIQPFSIVYHQEGNTFGADSPEKRRLMSQNKLIFQSKWKGQLNEYLPPGSTVVESRQRYVKARILWIDQVIPTPSFDSGMPCVQELYLYESKYECIYMQSMKIAHVNVNAWLTTTTY